MKMKTFFKLNVVRGHLTPKITNFFYHKLDAEYFFIRQFFWKNQYFPRKLWKSVSGTHLIIFEEKEASCFKN